MKTKTQRGYTLLEIALVVSLIAVLSGLATAGYSRYADRARVEQTRTVAISLMDLMQQRLKTGQGVGVEALAAGDAVPTQWLRGATGSFSIVGPLNSTMVPATGTVDVAPSNQTVQITINGLSPAQCTTLATNIETNSDELGVLDGATLTIVKRRGATTNVVFTAAAANTACQTNTNTKGLRVERKV